MKERIQLIIEWTRKSTLAFEKSINVSNGYLRNTKNISADVCSRILRTYPNISSDWLLIGNGEMLRQPSDGSEVLKGLANVIAAQQDALNEKTRTIALLEDENKRLRQQIEKKNE